MGKGKDILGLLIVGMLALVFLGGSASPLEQLKDIYEQTAGNETLGYISFNESSGDFSLVRYADFLGDNATYEFTGDGTYFIGDVDYHYTSYSVNSYWTQYVRLGENTSALLVFFDEGKALDWMRQYLENGVDAEILLYAPEVETELGHYEGVWVRVRDIGEFNLTGNDSRVFCYYGGQDVACWFENERELEAEGVFDVVEYDEYSGNILQDILRGLLDTLGLHNVISVSSLKNVSITQVDFHFNFEPKALVFDGNRVQYAYFSGIQGFAQAYDGSVDPCVYLTDLVSEGSSCAVEVFSRNCVGVKCRFTDGKCYFAYKT